MGLNKKGLVSKIIHLFDVYPEEWNLSSTGDVTHTKGCFTLEFPFLTFSFLVRIRHLQESVSIRWFRAIKIRWAMRKWRREFINKQESKIMQEIEDSLRNTQNLTIREISKKRMNGDL